MAFDQNSIPVDLRPLNLLRTVAEEPRIVTPVSTAVRNIEGLFPNPHRDVCSPMAMPVYYPATISNPGYVGVGFGNVSPGLAFCPRMATPSANQTPVNPTGGLGYNPNLGEQIGGSAASQASSEGGDDSVSGRKVKFLCSFGGKILPRPSDGMLRYAGGQTRIVSARRDACFSELVQKMVDTCGQPVVIKYQLPDEDLDALVSVSCPDDLENMMDEYEKLIERSSDGSCKLRLFLFSASELDSPSTVHLRDFQDGGQRYVDAVNGVLDGFGGGITRKESIASFASTQNSDLSGTDAIESSSTGQGDLNGPPSSSMLSPRTNTASSSDTAPKLVSTELNPSTYATSAGVPLGILPVKSTQPEIERSAPVNLQQQPVGLSLEQAGMEIPPLSPYLPSYVDSHSGAINHTEILQVPPQMGYPNPHVLGTVGSVFNQPQLRDSAASVRTHQYIAVPHMTIAPSSPNIGIESNVVHSLLQPQQTRMENIPKESTFGPRVVPLSGNQGYGAYQTRATPGVVGGGYAWHQAPASGHVILSDGWVAQQQLMFPEKTQRFEDCYMCQKALPHAHSDTVAQDPRNSRPTSVSDSNTVYHSLQPGDNNRSWLANKAGVTGALGEGSADRHGAGALPRALGHKDNSQNLEAACDGDRIMTQKVDSSDHPVMPVPHGVMGLAGDVQSPYGAFVGTIAQSSQGDTIQPPSVPKHYQVRQDAMLNKPIISDIPHTGGVPYESPKGYSNTPPGIVRKDDLLDSSISHDNQRPINGRMEALHVHDVSNEQNKSYVDMLVKEDILEHRQQQVARGDLLYDDTSVRPKTVLDANQRKAAEMPLYSDSSYLHNLPPVEPYELGRQPIMDSKIGILHLPSDEAYYGNPASSGVDSVHLTDRMAPVTEWKDSTWQFQPNLVPINVENVPSNGRSTILSPIPPTSRYGEGGTQDSPDSLFSIQGPWNYLNDDHRLPPKPNKIMTKRDPVGASENQVGNNGELNSEVRLDDGVPLPQANLNNDLSSMHVGSKKGSAEEAIGQELQDVAVDVASSVLQSCLPSHPDLPVYEIDGSISEGNRDVEVQDSDAETKDIKTKHLEKTNIGFPVSDGIGRLQIIKNIDLEELRELGSGTFGTVYHGKWRGTDVAIKRINDRCFVGKPSEQERMRDDFWNEAIKLADLHHPNVVAFYGVVLDGPGGSVATVTEYMVNGSLRTALQKNEKNLDKRKRLLIAMDVAFGMEYLHEKNIVHFDLKSDNLLVNLRDPHRPICKVGDLGLSKVKCQTLISGGVRGTLPWMAPELLNGSSSLVSEKVDVFSFGIVLWELLTGEEPYADLHYGAIIGGIVSNTLRPAVPESCDQEWKSLMERCWSSETSERPNFTDIASQLRSMAAKIPPKGQAQQQQQ